MRSRFAIVAGLVLAIAAAGCENKPTKEEEEAAKNTFACLLNNERLVVRFESGEARMLMPSGDRISLYQIPSASGVRFSNGTLELRGKGTELTLYENGAASPLVGCTQFTPPPAK